MTQNNDRTHIKESFRPLDQRITTERPSTGDEHAKPGPIKIGHSPITGKPQPPIKSEIPTTGEQEKKD